MEFKKYTVEELVKLDMLEKPMDGNHGGRHPTSKDYVENGIPFIMVSDINNGKINYKRCKFISKNTRDSLDKGFSKPNDVLLSHKATIGLTAIVGKEFEEIVLTPQLTYYRVKKNINNKYLKYYFDCQYFQDILNSWATSGSTRAYLGITAQLKLPIILPDIIAQNRIAKILSDIDKKIELNNKINDNLEEQLKLFFTNKFLKKIQENNIDGYIEKTLYDVLDVIDNRGKTPELVDISEYPILDVRAISGDDRIIDYNMCQKYVSEEIYNTFFRSGHPLKNDILISTVGSLAEMKVFIENKGTIAQNVVALRSKGNYPMYIYQYLKAIKYDLISYNIGSVQPSIKVTQFMKHKIFIPNDHELYEFENLAQKYTDKMFYLKKENENLIKLRDTLLPKLMNGEIDLDKIKI